MPQRHQERAAVHAPRVAAIVPTNMPSEITVHLVHDLVRHSSADIYVVDDCSRADETQVSARFAEMCAISPRVTVLRTPENKLKAGALNHALAHVERRGEEYGVLITLDDDVVIAPETVPSLVQKLMSRPVLAAVCSECRVFNKNVNILTRLQGLEYVGFNAIRLADEGFVRGPLVMHGMLTAFRASALRAVGGFREGHLIEDYEMTARLKASGWHVASAMNAPAWTVVPETLPRLWRQRTRWCYGGVTVVAETRSLISILQDVIGHSVFISMLLMVGVLLILRGSELVPLSLAQWIIGLSIVQFLISYAFQLWLLTTYREKDARDILLRATLVPEYLYSYLMTLALLGAYVFHSLVVLKRQLGLQGTFIFHRIERAFRTFGYTERQWGTRLSRAP